MACEVMMAGGVRVLVCGRSRRALRCAFCGAAAVALCDAPVIRRGRRRTCDARLCASCSRKPAMEGDLDLCPDHQDIDVKSDPATFGCPCLGA